jgi:hypothetical protein
VCANRVAVATSPLAQRRENKNAANPLD